MSPAKLDYKKFRFIPTALLCAWLGLFFPACATVETFLPGEGVLGVSRALPKEHDLYIYADVNANRDIFDQLISMLGVEEDRVRRVADQTEHLFLSVDDIGSENVSFTAIASGNYPTAMLSFGLRIDSEWQRHKTDFLWYQAKGRNLQIGLPGAGHIFISSSSMERMAEGWDDVVDVRQPERSSKSFASFLEEYGTGAIAVVYAANLGSFSSFLGEEISQMRGRALILMEEAQDGYEARFLLFFERAAAARVTALMLRAYALRERKNGSARFGEDVVIKADDRTTLVYPVYIKKEEVINLIGLLEQNEVIFK